MPVQHAQKSRFFLFRKSERMPDCVAHCLGCHVRNFSACRRNALMKLISSSLNVIPFISFPLGTPQIEILVKVCVGKWYCCRLKIISGQSSCYQERLFSRQSKRSLYASDS